MTKARANGKYTTNGVPHGSTSITPHIVVTPLERALTMYVEVFGAKVSDVTRVKGIVAHAVLDFPLGRLTLSVPLPAYELVEQAPGGVSYSLALYVADVDAIVERAVAFGAQLKKAPTTFVSGDRFASIVDPFGVRWALMTRVEDLSPRESTARVVRWVREQARKLREGAPEGTEYDD